MSYLYNRDLSKLLELPLPSVNNYLRKLMADDAELFEIQDGDATRRALHPRLVRSFLDYRGYSVTKDRIISWQIMKGGVGKSSLVTQVASRLASILGSKCLLIDLDPQANATATFAKRLQTQKEEGSLPQEYEESLEILHNPNIGGTWLDLLERETLSLKDIVVPVMPYLDIVKSRFSLHKLDRAMIVDGSRWEDCVKGILRGERNGVPGTGPIIDGYDFVLIDNPPAISASVSAAFIASDQIIMPVRCDHYSLAALSENLSEFKNLTSKFRVSPELMILINAFDKREKTQIEVLADMYSTFKDQRFFATPIRRAAEIPAAIRSGRTIWESPKKSPVADDVDDLVMSILKLEQPQIAHSPKIRERGSESALGG